jgi:hypothetical protein
MTDRELLTTISSHPASGLLHLRGQTTFVSNLFELSIKEVTNRQTADGDALLA